VDVSPFPERFRESLIRLDSEATGVKQQGLSVYAPFTNTVNNPNFEPNAASETLRNLESMVIQHVQYFYL